MKKPGLPSLAFVLALVALFVALGGTSYAITRVDRNSVSSRHIKKGPTSSAAAGAPARSKTATL
jgi:hypothetical protein